MWTLMHESGFGAWVSLFLTVIGLAAVVTVGRKRGRPGGIAATWAVAVLASGAREASANLFLAGFEALALSAVGGALSLLVRPKDGAAT